ncbi:MAG: hypothetical protein GW859_03785 [Sphingomonadales bacterium]|nr:hypothetical protein [Sphingomonadales bacterium]
MVKQFGMFALLVIVAVAFFAPSLPAPDETALPEQSVPDAAQSSPAAPIPTPVFDDNPQMIEQPSFVPDMQALPDDGPPPSRNEARALPNEVVPTDRPIPPELR